MSDENQTQQPAAELQEIRSDTPTAPEAPDTAPANATAEPSRENSDAPAKMTIPAAPEPEATETPAAAAAARPTTDEPGAPEGPMPPEPPEPAPLPATAEAIAVGVGSASASSPTHRASVANALPSRPSAPESAAAPSSMPTLWAAASSVATLVATAVDERIVPLRMMPLRRPRRIRPLVWGALAGGAMLIVLPVLLAATLWPALGVISPFGGAPDRIPRGASAWATAKSHTPLSPANSAFGAQSYPVAAEFATTYAARGGQTILGPAVTPAFTCNLGRVQFFAAGALLRTNGNAPESAQARPDDLDPSLLRDADVDPASGIVWLPLSHTLLAGGSAAPIGDASSGVTYATLRAATQAADLRPQPTNTTHIKANAPLPQTIATGAGAFVVEGSLGGKLVGHSIPPSIWAYIQQPQVSPHGWMRDVGEPLTEPMRLTVTNNGQPHELLAQVFWQTIIITNPSNPQATSMESIGLDYLRTFGAPNAYPSAGAQRWTTQDGALRSAPGATSLAVSLSANAGVTLTGAAQWHGGALWYGAKWSSPSRSGSAWVDVGMLSASQPSGPVTAGFDALSPSLASYLNGQSDDVGVVVYDITHNMTYTFQPNQKFIMASSAKVPLMVSYLSYIEAQGRGPNGYEQYILSAMIENSDNNAAQVIYDTIGYDAGQQSYMRAWGITDYTPDPNGWGWGQWSPADMAHLLTLLQTGKVLNSSDRALALHLMQSVESDQRFGVGDTAPVGATVAMKDGWVPGPDGAWAVNTSGIVTRGNETYIITVYTKEQDSFSSGEDIVNHVCGAVAQALN